MILLYKGIEVNYNVSGNGKALVFLHGFMENSRMWKNILPSFEEKYKCIVIDLLGHGKTDCLGYVHSMEDMALAVHAVLNFLKTENYTVVGHSMGGYVGLALLNLFPVKISGLVLLNSTSLPDDEENKLNRDRAIAIVKRNFDAYISMAIANLFAEENRIKLSTEIEKIRIASSKTPSQGIIAALEGMKIRKDRSGVLSAFNGKKILFAAKQDPVVLFEKSVLEAKECKVDLISFQGGHMTYLENKDQFIQSLQDFAEIV